MKDGFTTEKSPQPITNCRRCFLLPKELCSGLIKLVAVAANLPHELAGLFYGDVMLAREISNFVGFAICDLSPVGPATFSILAFTGMTAWDKRGFE